MRGAAQQHLVFTRYALHDPWDRVRSAEYPRPDFPNFPREPGKRLHAHLGPARTAASSAQPSLPLLWLLGRTVDDELWHEGREWTSAHRCRTCQMVWTHAWAYPNGEPYDQEASPGATPGQPPAETTQNPARFVGIASPTTRIIVSLTTLGNKGERHKNDNTATVRGMQVIAVAVLACLALVTRAVTGTWAHPSAVTALAWTVFLAIPTTAGMAEAPLTAVVIGAVTLGALAAAFITVRPSEVQPFRITSTTRLWRFVLAGSAAGGVAGWLVLHANGISLNESLDLAALGLVARDATVLRYESRLSFPIPAILLLGVTYGAALVAPFAAAGFKGPRKVTLLAAPTVGGGLYSLATTARAGFLIPAAITTAAWLMSLAISQGGRPRLRPKSLLGALVAIGAVTFMFVTVAATRMGGWDSRIAARMMDTVAVYAGGAIPAFERWASSGDEGVPSFGVETMAGISQFLLQDMSLGAAYTDRVPIGNGLTTNVYTILRPLSEDFTLPGAILVLWLGSVLAASLYRRAIVLGSVTAAGLAAIWMAIVLFSSTTSLLTFANVVVGFAIGVWQMHRNVSFVLLNDEPACGTERLVGVR